MKKPFGYYGLFGWNYRHLLAHPWVLAKESYYHTKWFMQRGWRGYADCDVWSLDYYLAGWMPGALAKLRTNKLGHPMGMTSKGWQTRLKHMESAFLEAKKISDMDYTTPKEMRAAERRMQRGLSVFTEHFLSLWD